MQGHDYTKITHLITVSCTGMSAPGIEIQLKQKLPLNNSVQTYAINFVGCYAFFPALKMADAFVQSNPNASVLIAAVELCTLHFQNKDSEDHLLSNALFADGAAACLVTSEKFGKNSLQLLNTEQLLLPKGANDMAWNISSEGFLMKLSSYIPQLIDEGLTQLLTTILTSLNLNKEELKHWAVHPGGKRILEVFEKELSLNNEELRHSYETLKNYGNMSAPTIFFVLKEFLNDSEIGQSEKLFSCGFGPGLTIEAAVFQIDQHA
jgi:predicted naringenin-chalcone synthase